MAYLGVTPTQEFSSVAKQSVTGDGSVSYTLNKGVSDANDLAVFVNDVRQEPGVAYTATANTITFTANLESTDECYILHIGRTFSSAESPGIEDKATQKVLTITTDGHLVPTANVTYDLGTSDLRFRDIYLSGSSINLGDHSITANATHISMGNVVATSVDATDTFTVTSSANTSSAGPELILYRDSDSPDDGDYLGQIQFKGKNDNNGDEIYAKVTGKISDASLGTEDGLIETAIKGAGSFTIVSRQRSDELQLLNGVGLSVAGDTTLSNNVTISETLTIAGDLIVNGNTTTIAANELKVEDSLIQLASNNEISDTVDIGFVGHYYDGSTQVHTGFFRDASDEQYYLFKGYEDADFDTDTPPATIDRTANTFTLADLNVGAFTSTGIDDNATSTAITIDSSGNVGIGATGLVDNSLSLLSTHNLSFAESTNSSYANIFREASSAATVLASGYRRSETSNKMDSSIAASWGKSAVWAGHQSIRFYVDAASADAVGTDLTPTERMRIDSSGNVGIGATVPSAFFSGATNLVVGGGVDDEGITVYSGTTGSGRLHFADGTSGTSEYDGFVVYNHSTQKMLLGSSGVTRATIDSAGNFGIGTQDPDVKLDIKYAGDDPVGTSTRVGAFSIKGGHTSLDMGANDGSPYNSWIQTRHNNLDTYPTAYYNLAINPLGGNVGIGESDPQKKLSVIGGILAATTSGSTSGITIDSTATSGYVSTITHTDTGMEFDTGAITRHFEFDAAGTNLWTIYTNTGNIQQNYGSYRFAAATSGSDTGSQFQLWGTNGGPGYLAAYQLNFNTGGNNSRTTSMHIDNNGHVGIGTTSPYDSAWGVNSGQLAISGADYGVLHLVDTGGPTRFSIGAGDGSLYLAYDDVAAAHRIIVDSSGNVGIGAAPSSAYGRFRIGDDNSDIDMDVNAKGQFHIDGNGYGFGIALNTDGVQIYNNSPSRSLIFGTDETERMRIDASGTLGIATTPNTMHADYDGIQVQNSLWFTNSSSFSGFTQNAYYDGSYKYTTTGETSLFRQISGNFEFLSAASGTADTAISFTQTFEINQNGTVQINGSNTPDANAWLNIGSSGNGVTRAIDIDGSWAGNESKVIGFTYGSGDVAAISAQYLNPGARLMFGKLYHSGAGANYSMWLESLDITNSKLKVQGEFELSGENFTIDHSNGGLYRNLGTVMGSASNGRYIHVKTNAVWGEQSMTMFRITGYFPYNAYAEGYLGGYLYGVSSYRSVPYGVIYANQGNHAVAHSMYYSQGTGAELILVLDWNTNYNGLMIEHIGAGSSYGDGMRDDLEIVAYTWSSATTGVY